jgi:hypothetical protein
VERHPKLQQGQPDRLPAEELLPLGARARHHVLPRHVEVQGTEPLPVLVRPSHRHLGVEIERFRGRLRTLQIHGPDQLLDRDMTLLPSRRIPDPRTVPSRSMKKRVEAADA